VPNAADVLAFLCSCVSLELNPCALAIQVAKAFPIKNHNLQNHGKYGHMTEDILTTHHGYNHVAKVRLVFSV